MAQLKISIKMAAAATISSTNWKIFTLNFCCKVCVASEMTDSVVEAVELALSAAFWAARGWWVVVCYAGLTFCYSALAAVLPALSTDLFGLPHAGVNYGFLALGQSVGSLAFPFAANLLALENGRHLLAMAGAAAGFAAIWALHPVQKDPR